MSEKHHDVDKLIRDLFAAGPVEHDFCAGLLVDLFHRSHASLAQSPTVLDLNSPLQICGDIHGQYADLLNIFVKCGWPFNTRYLFLGDYVDRGKHSLEVLVLITALQLRFPNNVYLLRGNHESPSVNISYGFLSELRARYHKKNECDLIWEKIGKVFSELPIAAVVCHTILCIHGGLSPSLKSIQDLRNLMRGQEEPAGLLEDLLWADPSPTCKGFNPNDDRGCSYTFGDDAIAQQCKQLGVNMIIRGHQVVDNGFRFSNKNKVLTLFSAPSYSDDFHNRATVLQISRHGEITFTFLEARKMSRVGKTATVLRSTH